MQKIKVGDTVKVIKEHFEYSGYKNWAEFHNLDLFKSSLDNVNCGGVGVIVAVEAHFSRGNTLCGVLINGRHHIFGIEALDLCKPKPTIKTRKEVAQFINSGELGALVNDDNKPHCDHFGKVELRMLMDFIYQDNKPSDDELIIRLERTWKESQELLKKGKG